MIRRHVVHCLCNCTLNDISQLLRALFLTLSGLHCALRPAVAAAEPPVTVLEMQLCTLSVL